jgi:hypothetical protein
LIRHKFNSMLVIPASNIRHPASPSNAEAFLEGTTPTGMLDAGCRMLI